VTTSQPIPWLNSQQNRSNMPAAPSSSSFSNPMAQGLSQTTTTSVATRTAPDSDWEDKLITNACQAGGARIQPPQVEENFKEILNLWECLNNLCSFVSYFSECRFGFGYSFREN
jgi:hypothetical protein